MILNYKTSGLLKYCLRSIVEHPPKSTYEIIVVDNASGDPLRALEVEFPAARFFRLSANRGYASGNNAGLSVASGSVLAILNPDIIAYPNAFDQLLQALEADTTVGVVGPKLLNPDRSVQLSCNRFYSPLTPFVRRTVLGRTAFGQRILRRDLMIDFDHDRAADVDWLMGSALFVRKEALSQVGMLDERFFLYFEDMDWCRRFWGKGWRVRYVPEAVMVHFHRRQSADRPWSRHTRIHIASAFKYFAKHGLRAPAQRSL